MSQESYERAARLVYISRYLIDGPKVALIQAHRVAAEAVAAHPDDDAAAVREALATAMNRMDAWVSGRGWFRGPRLAPADVTSEQREVLERLKAVDYHAARVALLVLLENVPVEEAALLLGTERFEHQVATVREGIASLCGGRAPDEIRALLLGHELDPMVVPVSARAALKRRRRRIRTGGIVTAVIVLLAGAGVWWFGVRVPPLGTYADDPQIQTRARIFADDYGLNAWPARGELLGDTALLRRAAGTWRAKGLPANVSEESGTKSGPRVLFAGHVRDIRVVVMFAIDASSSDSGSIAVYTENLGAEKDRFRTEADSQVLVNRTFESDPAGPGAIRLLDPDVYQIDPLLLPPTVADVETGPLDTPTAGWQSAHPDSQGVMDIPVPQETVQQATDTHWSPSEGVRFTETNQNVVMAAHATVPEAFRDTSVLLPVLASDYLDRQALTSADWCAIRQDAEVAPDSFGYHAGYTVESYSDVASGPLPDGGGTGTLITQEAYGPQQQYFSTPELLSQPSPSCDKAAVSETGNRFGYAGDGVPDESGRSFVSPVTSAMVWTSSLNQHYLVVAAAPGVAKLRVSGPATGSADGRWLVVPLPYVTSNLGVPSEAPLIEAFDAVGHRCGDPDPSKTNAQYCYK
jgi:hypothetical protein